MDKEQYIACYCPAVGAEINQKLSKVNFQGEYSNVLCMQTLVGLWVYFWLEKLSDN